MRRKIVIIGGGFSGLATAALLSKNKNYKITLLEKNETLGGRARAFKAKGFSFDMGPSWYFMPDVFEKFFAKLNYKVSQLYALKKLDPKYKIFFGDGETLVADSENKKIFEFFENTEKGSTKKLSKLLKISSKLYKLVTNNIIYESFYKLSAFFNPLNILAIFKLLFLLNPFISYHNFVKKFIKNPKLQQILEYHTVFLGGSPYNTPSLYSMLISTDFHEKVWYPMGGFISIVNALEKICLENGVKIITNSEVTKFQYSDEEPNIKNKNLITTVVTKEKKYPTDIVISACDYHFIETKILPEKFQTYDQKYWQKKQMAISAMLIYLGVNKKIKNLEHHNLYFSSNWEKHFRDTFEINKWPENPCYYLSTPSKTDPSVAPKNKENLFVLVPVSSNMSDEKRLEYADYVLSHIEKTTKTKFISDIIYKKIYTHRDFINDYNAFKGTALGISHSLLQTSIFRPRIKSKKIDNLYYTGQYTQPGVGVPMTLISAEMLEKIINEN